MVKGKRIRKDAANQQVLSLEFPPEEQGKRRRPSCEVIHEEVLEAYLLRRLPGQQRRDVDDVEVRAVETHLLLCADCQDRAWFMERELRQLRAVLRRLPDAGESPARALAVGGQLVMRFGCA